MSYSYEADKEQLQKRLRRVEGQIRGIQKMIDENKYCIDILTQLSSVVAATQKVSLLILENHINGCVKESLSKENGQEKVSEMINAINRFIRS